MKKTIMAVIGITLFVAAYQISRRQTEYLTAKSTITTTDTYVAAPPTPLPASVKSSLAFRLVNPS